MTSHLKYYILLFLIITSCTEVVDVDVPNEVPRLVIEASLDWEKGTLGNEQTIYLSLSTPYFDSEQINPVSGATVKVINNTNNAEFVFADHNNGAYSNYSFIPELNQKYTLEVLYNNELYTAEETMMPVVDIEEVYQSTENGFDKENMEVNIVFTDPAAFENFYLMNFQKQGDYLPELFDYSDEFTNGNRIELFYEDEFIVGDTIEISLYGISKQYYNFIKLLIEQSYDGGPFATIPTQLKGNCINVSNAENYAFGYFRLTQVSKETYTFE